MFIKNRSTWWFWSTFLVLVSCVLAYPRDHGEKKVNLKIGFDLTQEVNGEPALRIRDFEDSETYPRAVDSSEKKHHGNHAIRADSFSDSNDDPKDALEVKEVKKPKKAKRERERDKSSKSKESSNSNSNDDESDEKKIRSTAGIRAGEFDAEDGNAKVHGREPDDSDAR